MEKLVFSAKGCAKGKKEIGRHQSQRAQKLSSQTGLAKDPGLTIHEPPLARGN